MKTPKKEPYVSLTHCRACDKEGLHWKRVCGAWRLFEEDGKIHDCPVTPMVERYVVCNRCGKTGLRWMNDEEGKRLIEKSGSAHRCKKLKDMRKLPKQFDRKNQKW